MAVYRTDKGQAKARKRKDSGALMVDARLTRTGVFTYTKADGSPWKEYRPPEEVFHADSLDSLRGVSVVVGHPDGGVNAESWKKLATGDVRDDVRQDGDFVQATLAINDSTTVARAESKELVEVSCGYFCELDPTPGEVNGERFDAVQRNIRYNHVALGPKDWGRAGPEVRLLLDSKDQVETPSSLWTMTPEQIEKLVADKAKAEARADAAEKEGQALQAKLDTATEKVKDLEAKLPVLVQERVALLDKARACGVAIKTDASEAEVLTACIQALKPEAKLDGKDLPYLRARYDGLVEDGGTDKLRERADSVHRESTVAVDPVEKARQKMLADIEAKRKEKK